MNSSLKGYIAGIVSAVTFGMNPFFGIQLYQENVQPISVLFYRFFFWFLRFCLRSRLANQAAEKTYKIPILRARCSKNMKRLV